MVSTEHPVRHTRAEYISFERASNVRHEFLDGSIYAMAGGSREHALIAMNIGTLLNIGLRGKRCGVHSSDLRIRVVETGLETYPDVTVVCGHAELDPSDEHVVLNPVLVVEVTSPSTEDYDRRDKLTHYQRIPTLREVVLVSHRERHVVALRRGDDGSWCRQEARAGEKLALSSVGCELQVDEVYGDPLA